jgi:integrase
MATIDVICYKYTPLKNHELPLKIRICKNRKTRYISLNVSTKAEHWDFENNRPKDNSPDKELLDKLIAQKISEIRSKIVELKSENKDFTSSSLVSIVANPNPPKTVAELFKSHIQTLKEDKRTRYMQSVQQVYNCMREFNGHLDIYFSDIDTVWLKKYESWLRKKGNATNTIGLKFRTLRMVFNLAIEMKLVKPEFYPFRKYKVSRLHQNTAKRAITKGEIQSIIHYKSDKDSFYTRLAIDLFTFSYYMGGINFVDMAHLTEKNIIDNKLVYYRKKTGKLISLPIQRMALLSLVDYKKNHENSGYLFPILSKGHRTEVQIQNRIHKVITKVNRELKSIGKELNIPINLTTYVARHSYATILKRAGVATSVISETLGHSSEKVTQIYLDSFEKKQIEKAMENL